MANYRGYTISANPNISESQLNSAFNGVRDSLSSIIAAAQAKYNDLVAYAASPPPVSVGAISIDLGTAEQAVNDAITTAVKTVTNVIAAIEDYSDGNWDNPSNKQFLDDFIKNYGGGGGSPRGNDGGGPASPTTPETTDPDILNSDELGEINESISGSGPEGSNVNNTDEEIVMSQVGESIVSDGVEVVPMMDADSEILESEGDNVMGELGTSISGAFSGIGTASIPSPSVGSVDGLKSSSVLGVSGIAAAAAAAIGGAIFYSSSKEDDESEEENENSDVQEENSDNANETIDVVDTDSEPSNEEINLDTGGFMAGKSAVDFKNQLLDSGEVND